ncbi:MAG: hypothetical protein ABIH21_03830 [Patescibacteria group bacterium]
MNERTKRILLIIGFIVSIILIGLALYFLFFKAELTTPPSTQVEQPISGLQPGEISPPTPFEPGVQRRPLSEASPVAKGGLTQIETVIETQTSNIALSGSGNGVNFYNNEDGRFYTIDQSGNIKSLSDKTFPQAKDVEWNKDSNKAIIEFPDGSNVVFNFDTQKQTTLPKHFEDFQFSPVKDEFIAKSMALDPSNRWLVTSNDDGSGTKAFQALGTKANRVTVNWSPNDQVVAFSDTGYPLTGGLDRKMIVPIGKNQENFKGLVVEGLGFESKWTPGGKQLLYSVHSDYSDLKPLLWFSDAAPNTMGNNRKSIPLNTWVDKCTISSNTDAYCAVPVNLPPNAGLQRRLFEDYPDRLYHVDLKTGAISILAIPEQDTTMTSLQVTNDGSALYYINKETNKLESIRLK